jgi:peroxiredoxin
MAASRLGWKMALTESNYRMKRGVEAPDFTLPATDGKTYSLKNFKGCKSLLVVFMCNHCPYVKAKLDEMIRIYKDYHGKGLAMAGINSNNEITHPDDSFENMEKMVKERGINFVYLRDESQEVAKAYGATCTPDPFLFDANFKLVFHSRIDDTHGQDPVEKHELHNAIGEFLSTGKISLKEKPSMGCNIKWK